MSGPRVPLLSPEDAAKRAEEVDVAPRFAELNIFRVLLHQPLVAKAIQDLLVALLFRGQLDARLRELVILRIGWATASEYEWTQHWRVATDLGIDSEDLLAVRDWRRSDRFGAVEKAVLAATDETLETGSLCDATWAACRQHLESEVVLVELVAAIACWRNVSSLLRSLRVPLEEGVAAWPPDGAAPNR